MTRSRFLRLIREAFAASFSRPVPTLLTVLVIASATATVLLTAGRSAAAQQEVIDTFDDVGTRRIVVQAPVSAGLESDVLSRLLPLEGIEEASALGPAVDVTNSLIPGSTKVAMRDLWTSGTKASIVNEEDLRLAARGSKDALQLLGMSVSGSVVDGDGVITDVVGLWDTPAYLESLGPTVVVPKQPAQLGRVNQIIVIADEPEHVAAIAEALVRSLGVVDQSEITVKTSEQLALLRHAVNEHLGSYGREIVLISFGVTGLLVGAVLYALVLMRRKDFGRRRALGATRAYILSLLLVQTLVTAIFGTALGGVVALGALYLQGEPTPTIPFSVGVSLMIVAVATVAAVPPAISAALKDPVRELRVP